MAEVQSNNILKTPSHPWRYFSTATGILALSLFLLAHCVASFLAFGSYSLNSSDRWLSAKRFTIGGLGGAVESVMQRQQISGARLNFNSWHGGNEFLFKDPVALGKLKFQTKLSSKSGLYVLIYREKLPSLGVFLSAHNSMSSAVFEISKDGALSKIQNLMIEVPFDSSLWISVTLFERTIKIALDRQVEEVPLKEDFALRTPGDRHSIIGFRSLNALPLWVDDLVLVDSSDEIVLKDDFDHSGFVREIRAKLIPIFAIAMILILIAIASIPRLRRRSREASVALVASIMTLSIAFWATHLFDVYFYSKLFLVPSRLYLGPSVMPTVPLFGFESYRKLAISASIEALGLQPKHFELNNNCNEVQRIRADKRCAQRKVDDFVLDDGIEPRLFQADDLRPLTSELATTKTPITVFAGTSQTWGAGASSLHATWTHLVTKNLVARKMTSQSLNISISGSRISEVSKSIDALLAPPSKLEIPFLILNFGNNDSREPELVRVGLQKLISSYGSRVRKIVLIDEPKNRITQNAVVSQIITNLGSINKVHVCRPAGELAKLVRLNKGFVWWDHIHFDDYGHQKMAELISACLREP